MGNLPRPVIRPISLALAGGFLTTGPGKFQSLNFFFFPLPFLTLLQSILSTFEWTGAMTSIFVHTSLCACFLLVCLFFGCSMWDLSSLTGIEPTAPAVKAWHLNHWIPREVCFVFRLISYRWNCWVRLMGPVEILHSWDFDIYCRFAPQKGFLTFTVFKYQKILLHMWKSHFPIPLPTIFLIW